MHLNCGTSHVTEYSESDIYIADCIRLVRLNLGNFSVLEEFPLYSYSCCLFSLFYLLLVCVSMIML